MTREGVVSVVMPCYDAGRYLEESVSSVLAQGDLVSELLVVDDGSGDDSIERLEAWRERDARVRILRTAGRQGPAAARNVGIDAAAARYVAFLDADDVWLRGKLSAQLALMEARGLLFTWCPFQEFSDGGDDGRVIASRSRISYRDLLHKRTVIGCSTVVYDTRPRGKFFMPDIRMRQDLGLWLRMIELCERDADLRAQGLEHVMVRYRLHSRSLSASKLKAAYWQWRLLRDIEGLGLPASLVAFGAYGTRSLLARW